MPTTRIQEKISRLVRSQLPEHISYEYETFVKFLEYYYEFIEQDQGAQEIIQNARSYADIDRTVSGFVGYFLKNYGDRLPQAIVADKPLLIKNLRSLYEAKGSELSFQLLFRILFNTSASVKYPYENVLRASDGTWQQLVSIRVETISGTPDKLPNHILHAVKNSLNYSSSVIKTTTLTSTLTEVFLEAFSTIVIDNVLEEDDEIFVLENGAEVFRGRVKLTTVSYSIQNGGTGFRAGQIFKVNSAGAVNTLFKVTNVTSQGAITEISYVNYGYNFTSSVVLNFNAQSVLGSVSDEYNTTTNGFSETGIVYTNGDYFDSNYTNDVTYVMTSQETFANVYSVAGGTIAGTIDDTFATITFTLGVLGRYPGSWTTNRGFISDNDIRLEDSNLYQPFAYQLNTEIDINQFYDTVTNTIHPAGQKLFNNRILLATANIQANINAIVSANIFTELDDAITLIDNATLALSRTVSDTVSEPSDSANLSVYLSINNADSTISVTDTSISGTLYAQDYVDDITYFGNIYVASAITSVIP